MDQKYEMLKIGDKQKTLDSFLYSMFKSRVRLLFPHFLRSMKTPCLKKVVLIKLNYIVKAPKVRKNA
jgi:hypothetical protein